MGTSCARMNSGKGGVGWQDLTTIHRSSHEPSRVWKLCSESSESRNLLLHVVGARSCPTFTSAANSCPMSDTPPSHPEVDRYTTTWGVHHSRDPRDACISMQFYHSKPRFSANLPAMLGEFSFGASSDRFPPACRDSSTHSTPAITTPLYRPVGCLRRASLGPSRARRSFPMSR